MEEINLYKLLRFYVQNWLLIVSLTLVGLAAGLAYNEFIQVPMYKSNATLLFVNSAGGSSAQDSTRLSNYVQLFQSRRVLEPVISEQQLGVTFDEFIGGVSATNAKGTEVISLSVSTNNPQKSQNFLHAAVIAFKAEAKELYGTDSLKVVDNASSAEPPYNVKKPLQLAIATGAGFVVSLIVLFFIYDASGGKAGKLGLKKNVNKQAKRSAAPVATPPEPVVADVVAEVSAVRTEVTPDVAPDTTTQAVDSESDVRSAAPTVAPAPHAEAAAASDSKVKAFFAQLGQDFKEGLWIEQPSDKAEGEAAVKELAAMLAESEKKAAAAKTAAKPAAKKASKTAATPAKASKATKAKAPAKKPAAKKPKTTKD